MSEEWCAFNTNRYLAEHTNRYSTKRRPHALAGRRSGRTDINASFDAASDSGLDDAIEAALTIIHYAGIDADVP